VSPNPLILNSQSYSTADLNINYTILPPSYTANTAQVDLLGATPNGGAPLPVMSFVGNTSGSGTVTLNKGSQLDATKNYSVQVVLNRGITSLQISSDIVPFNAMRFYIKVPPGELKYTITNDTNGVPQMPTDKPIGVLEAGSMKITSDVNWTMTTWYQVILPPGYNSRERNDSFGLTWTSPANQGVSIPWGTNFGGGMVTLTASINVSGVNLSDTVYGLIEGQQLDSTFKQYETSYLDNPSSDQNSPTIRDQVGSPHFFRVIAYIETGYKHFDWSIWAEPGGSIFPTESFNGDGGFGLMQLTDPRPAYRQIWNYRDNVDAAVELIGEKLAAAKNYINVHPVSTTDPNAIAKTQKLLKMETYSLYRGGHYWEWNDRYDMWKARTFKSRKLYLDSGVYEANRAQNIENNLP
jgi:hypothetical protein